MTMGYHTQIVPVLDVEENFKHEGVINAMKESERWMYTIPVSLVYITAVHLGRRYMETKTAWKLRTPLIIWSGLLALFSWLGTIRTTVFLIMVLKNEGLLASICGIRHKLDGPGWFWLNLFVMSKLPELGDTFFIVARKRKLHFLHWYHHVTVFIYSFYMCAHPQSGMIWYAGMNFAVHALMYTYYTLRAAGVRIPRTCAMFVTTCQLSQMVVGVGLQVVSSYMLYTGHSCDTTVRDIAFGLGIYASYMVLFTHFFYNTYISTKGKVKAQ